MTIENYSLPKALGTDNRTLVYFPKDLVELLMQERTQREYQWETLARLCMEGALANKRVSITKAA